MMLRADLTMLPAAPELRPRTRVRFHLATTEVGARVVATGSPVSAGSRRTVRVVLDELVMARTGDRFVLRSASPLATIGGGIVTDSNAPRRARPMPTLALSLAERFQLLVDEAGGHGLPVASLPIRLGGDFVDAAAPPSGAARVGDRWYAVDVIATIRGSIVQLVQAHHDERPLDPGAPRQDIRSRLSLDSELFDEMVGYLVRERVLSTSGADLRIAGWAPALSGLQQQVTDQIVAALEAAGAEPPAVSELEPKYGKSTLTLLRHLERQGLVVQVEDTRFYSPKSVQDLVAKLEKGMAGRGEVAPADLKEVLGFSRKFLIPFLEYCDRRGLTSRQGNGRVWRGATS